MQRPGGKTAWKIQEWNDRGYSCPKESSRREFTLCGYFLGPPKFLRLLYLCVEIRVSFGVISRGAAHVAFGDSVSLWDWALRGKLPVSLFPVPGLKCSPPCVSVYMDAGT